MNPAAKAAVLQEIIDLMEEAMMKGVKKKGAPEAVAVEQTKVELDPTSDLAAEAEEDLGDEDMDALLSEYEAPEEELG